MVIPDELAAKHALAAGHVVIVVADVRLDDFRRLQKGMVYRYRPGIHAVSHRLCLAGYDDAPGAWLVLNSFGKRWADAGFGLLGYRSCGLFDPASGDRGKGVRLLV